MVDSSPLLHLDSISLSYGEKVLYDNASLTMGAGRKFVIQGPSGSGKSSLLKIILGFVRPDSGRVVVNGVRLEPKTIWSIRRQMAYVPQEPELGDMRAKDVLKECFNYSANQANASNLERVPELLDVFGLEDSILQQNTRELSGGEKQRLVMIAASLLDRTLILMDEPSSALDPDSLQRVIEYFRSHENLSILAVSHDRAWEGFADQVITVGNGSLTL